VADRPSDSRVTDASAPIARRNFLAMTTFALGAVAAGTGIAACASGATTSSSSSSSPRRGGTIRAGLGGGGSSDTLDGQSPISDVDVARCCQLYNQLLEFDTNAVQQPALAEKLVPNSDATQWTIHLRQGVTWHNGKTFTADDVIYTFQRMVDPSNPLAGASAVALLDVPHMRKLDKYTVSAPCHASFATFPQVLSGEHFFIVPAGYNPKQPIGTGPFKFKSFTPGVRSVFVRNEDYWKQGLPYADAIDTIDFADQTSQLNALASNQVDVIDLLTAESIPVLKSNGNQSVVSEGGGFIPFTMRIDRPPFNDVRVRQAMRLIVNRPQLRELVYGGYGLLGNDVQSIWDPSYDHALSQREQDLEQAKFLLKQAGRSDLAVTLITSAVATGSVQAAQVLAQQAKGAGVQLIFRRSLRQSCTDLTI
jgi:peptide/nickel transport system substrate-binding protein